jgi:hypothetical protein
VTFPDYISKKFEQGKISHTALSDILRVSLLLVYGGLWLDPDYYLAKDISADMLARRTWYTIRRADSSGEADVVRGRWSGNFMLASKGNRLCQFLLASLYFYWKEQDELIDDGLMDYLIALAYDHFPDIRAEIDACPYSHPHVLDLQKELNRPYETCNFERYLEDTGVFKLNRHTSPDTQTVDGRPALYGILIEREFGEEL